MESRGGFFCNDVILFFILIFLILFWGVGGIGSNDFGLAKE
jgi:hypothetical protein